MTFDEISIPKCPVTEQSGGMLVFDSKAKSVGRYVNPLYHYVHEVAEGKRGPVYRPDEDPAANVGDPRNCAEVHRHQALDGEVILVLLPQAMTGVDTGTDWRFTFKAAVLHVGKKTGRVTGWLVSTHENGWFNYNAHKEVENDTSEHEHEPDSEE